MVSGAECDRPLRTLGARMTRIWRIFADERRGCPVMELAASNLISHPRNIRSIRVIRVSDVLSDLMNLNREL